MELIFKVDTLDGMESHFSELYEPCEGGFSLKPIKGMDNAENLKGILEKVRLERDTAKGQLSELDKIKSDAEKVKLDAEVSKLAQDKEFKKLWEIEQGKQTATATELTALKAEIADGKRSALALDVIAGLTKDPASNKMLQREAMDFIKSNPEGIAEIAGPDGIADQAKMTEYLRANFPRLVDASPAGGGGGNGGGQGVQSGEYINDYSEAVLNGLRDTNRPLYDGVMAKGYKPK